MQSEQISSELRTHRQHVDQFTKDMQKDEYKVFADARKSVSFTHKKAKRFRDWLELPRTADFKPNDDMLELLGSLAVVTATELIQDAQRLQQEWDAGAAQAAHEKSGTANVAGVGSVRARTAPTVASPASGAVIAGGAALNKSGEVAGAIGTTDTVGAAMLSRTSTTITITTKALLEVQRRRTRVRNALTMFQGGRVVSPASMRGWSVAG